MIDCNSIKKENFKEDSLILPNNSLIIFKTNYGYVKEIFINPNKTIKELIKLFFAEINRLELFNDKDIQFIYSSQIIDRNSEEPVSKLLEDNYVENPMIMVLDFEEKFNYNLMTNIKFEKSCKIMMVQSNQILKKKRNMPSTLQKDGKSPIESITFEVEKGLKPMTNSLYNQNIKEIFSNLFEKRKKVLNKKFRLVYANENEPLRILHYKFDTNETEFSNYGKKSLIYGLAFAYNNHFPINVSPDMIWILILQGYSRFMDKYSELVREKYVNFEGKKTIFLNLFGKTIDMATEEDWSRLLYECTEKISDFIGKEAILNLQSDFSTTNEATLLVSQTSIMSAMKNYFVYKGICGSCGISKIILEGTLEDWEKIKTKLNYLSKIGLNWWAKHLIPIIDNIIKTKKYYQKNMILNDELIHFWKNMIKIKDKYDVYVPDVFNGWIIKFFPNYNEDLPKLYDELKEEDIPDQIISCPLEILEVGKDGFKTNYKCDIASGFFGFIQDEKSLAVKPVIGYAIVEEEKETSLLSEEDKQKIVNNINN